MSASAARAETLERVLQRLASLHPKRIDLSLDRLARLLEALGNAERRVHVYTSPHLVRFNERIRLAGTLVDDAALIDVLTRVEAANAGEPITFFEITTAAAFVLFTEVAADTLLLEVGLGGRLDATNVVERPLLSVLTPIGIDHVGFLGPTVGEIAAEKAGIVKRGVPVVSAPQRPEATAVIERHAGLARAPLHLGGMDWHVSSENGRLVFQDEDGLADLPLPRLPGRHQVVNAGIAIAAARVARLVDGSAPLEAAMLNVDWPGRLQRLTRGRIVEWSPPGAEVWLDGGHNADAGEAVAGALADLEDRVSRPLFLIAGMLSTKEQVEYFRPFGGLVRHVFTVRIPGAEASVEAAALAAAAEEAGLSAEPVASVRTALRLLAENWRFEPPPRIVIGGSLYLVGDVLGQNGTPPA